MKTILMAGALAIASLAATANKSNKNKIADYRVTQSFERQFGDVSEVTWSISDNKMYKAVFTNNAEPVTAFFNNEGEFIASTIERSINDVPVKLRTAINKHEGAVTEIVELESDYDHAWYVKFLINGKEKIMKGYENGYLKEANL